MCTELVASYLVGEFFSFWIKIECYPADVVLGCVRMRNLFAHGNFDFRKFASTYCIRAFDNWNVFLQFPICLLK